MLIHRRQPGYNPPNIRIAHRGSCRKCLHIPTLQIVLLSWKNPQFDPLVGPYRRIEGKFFCSGRSGGRKISNRKLGSAIFLTLVGLCGIGPIGEQVRTDRVANAVIIGVNVVNKTPRPGPFVVGDRPTIISPRRPKDCVIGMSKDTQRRTTAKPSQCRAITRKRLMSGFARVVSSMPG